MTNAILRGKPDAGNPHVRFDEGEVASAKPRRGSLLYNRNVVIGVAGVIALVGAIHAKNLDRVVFLEAHPDDLASEMGTAVLMKGVYEMHVIDYTHGEWGCGEEKATNGWTKAKRTRTSY